MSARVFGSVLFVALLSPSFAFAQITDAAPSDVLAPVTDGHHQASQQVSAQGAVHRRASKGSSWPFRLTMGTLYTTTVVAQVYDVDSTLKSLQRGGVELNPVMSLASENRALFLGIKAAGVATTIWTAHHIGKRHKVGAVLTLLALNAAYYAIIQNNYAIARRPMGLE